ncbi:uncharacterized protein LOC34621874 [Cyclospora cayetanensis]|uniref:Uncharacterized protein LOC34621874 n=1 Tax=Cyclospora cayetanensis TaxID=88456 RepID=A0A6P6S240_9EIME|nr:uncharacterized protein LOC34621874 [Cyclospora cayetanensis]
MPPAHSLPWDAFLGRAAVAETASKDVACDAAAAAAAAGMAFDRGFKGAARRFGRHAQSGVSYRGKTQKKGSAAKAAARGSADTEDASFTMAGERGGAAQKQPQEGQQQQQEQAYERQEQQEQPQQEQLQPLEQFPKELTSRWGGSILSWTWRRSCMRQHQPPKSEAAAAAAEAARAAAAICYRPPAPTSLALQLLLLLLPHDIAMRLVVGKSATQCRQHVQPQQGEQLSQKQQAQQVGSREPPLAFPKQQGGQEEQQQHQAASSVRQGASAEKADPALTVVAMSSAVGGSPGNPRLHGRGFVRGEELPAAFLRLHFNFASLDAGARIIASSSGTQHIKAVQRPDADTYMLVPCSVVPKYFVLSFSETLKIDYVAVQSFEIYANAFWHIQLLGADSYPTRQWRLLANLQTAADVSSELFNVKAECAALGSCWTKFLKVRLLTHHDEGSHYYCSLTSFQVFGATGVQFLETQILDERVSSSGRVMGAEAESVEEGTAADVSAADSASASAGAAEAAADPTRDMYSAGTQGVAFQSTQTAVPTSPVTSEQQHAMKQAALAENLTLEQRQAVTRPASGEEGDAVKTPHQQQAVVQSLPSLGGERLSVDGSFRDAGNSTAQSWQSSNSSVNGVETPGEQSKLRQKGQGYGIVSETSRVLPSGDAVGGADFAAAPEYNVLDAPPQKQQILSAADKPEHAEPAAFSALSAALEMVLQQRQNLLLQQGEEHAPQQEIRAGETAWIEANGPVGVSSGAQELNLGSLEESVACTASSSSNARSGWHGHDQPLADPTTSRYVCMPLAGAAATAAAAAAVVAARPLLGSSSSPARHWVAADARKSSSLKPLHAAEASAEALQQTAAHARAFLLDMLQHQRQPGGRSIGAAFLRFLMTASPGSLEQQAETLHVLSLLLQPPAMDAQSRLRACWRAAEGGGIAGESVGGGEAMASASGSRDSKGEHVLVTLLERMKSLEGETATFKAAAAERQQQVQLQQQQLLQLTLLLQLQQQLGSFLFERLSAFDELIPHLSPLIQLLDDSEKAATAARLAKDAASVALHAAEVLQRSLCSEDAGAFLLLQRSCAAVSRISHAISSFAAAAASAAGTATTLSWRTLSNATSLAAGAWIRMSTTIRQAHVLSSYEGPGSSSTGSAFGQKSTLFQEDRGGMQPLMDASTAAFLLLIVFFLLACGGVLFWRLRHGQRVAAAAAGECALLRRSFEMLQQQHRVLVEQLQRCEREQQLLLLLTALHPSSKSSRSHMCRTKATGDAHANCAAAEQQPSAQATPSGRDAKYSPSESVLTEQAAAESTGFTPSLLRRLSTSLTPRVFRGLSRNSVATSDFSVVGAPTCSKGSNSSSLGDAHAAASQWLPRDLNKTSPEQDQQALQHRENSSGSQLPPQQEPQLHSSAAALLPALDTKSIRSLKLQRHTLRQHRRVGGASTPMASHPSGSTADADVFLLSDALDRSEELVRMQDGSGAAIAVDTAIAATPSMAPSCSSSRSSSACSTSGSRLQTRRASFFKSLLKSQLSIRGSSHPVYLLLQSTHRQGTSRAAETDFPPLDPDDAMMCSNSSSGSGGLTQQCPLASSASAPLRRHQSRSVSRCKCFSPSKRAAGEAGMPHEGATEVFDGAQAVGSTDHNGTGLTVDRRDSSNGSGFADERSAQGLSDGQSGRQHDGARVEDGVHTAVGTSHAALPLVQALDGRVTKVANAARGAMSSPRCLVEAESQPGGTSFSRIRTPSTAVQEGRQERGTADQASIPSAEIFLLQSNRQQDHDDGVTTGLHVPLIVLQSKPAACLTSCCMIPPVTAVQRISGGCISTALRAPLIICKVAFESPRGGPAKTAEASHRSLRGL